LPDGAAWQGLWTYTHIYQGEELEIVKDMTRQQLAKLIKH
jgi:hypothetical protein